MILPVLVAALPSERSALRVVDCVPVPCLALGAYWEAISVVRGVCTHRQHNDPPLCGGRMDHIAAALVLSDELYAELGDILLQEA